MEFTTESGSNYSNYGGCYYEVWNRLVHIHIGVSGLTVNTGNTITSIPLAIRPVATIFTLGGGGNQDLFTTVETRASGLVVVYPRGTYCGADVYYLI